MLQRLVKPKQLGEDGLAANKTLEYRSPELTTVDPWILFVRLRIGLGDAV